MKFFLIWALILPLIATAFGQEDDIHTIDMDKAWQLQARQREGQTLTPGEQAFVEKAMAYQQRVQDLLNRRRKSDPLTPDETNFLNRALEARQKRAEKAREAYRKAHPPRDSTGLIPITELGEKRYKDAKGGLYPNGQNAPPQVYLNLGLQHARQIVPRNADGTPSPDGKIVLLSQGMSNATQEFQAFMRLAANDPERNPHLLLVDGAVGSMTANRTADPESPFWQINNDRLAQADATRAQVQIIWIKQATPRPQAPFPAEARTLQQHLTANLNILVDRYPNLKIVYLSSRIYAGYAESNLNPEPHAYETAFAVKWLIADQIQNPESLATRPYLTWGPYLWADGLSPRKDGLTYTREDLAADGTHPSNAGREKVARQLLAFFKSDPTATPWFLKP